VLITDTTGNRLLFLERAFGPKHSKNIVNPTFTCPWCAEKLLGTKKKFTVRTDNWLTHCWVCGYKSRNIAETLARFRPDLLGEFVAAFLGSDGSLAVQVENGQHKFPWNDQSNVFGAMTLPEGYMFLGEILHWQKDGQLSDGLAAALAYCKQRNLTEQDVWRYKIGYCFTGKMAGRLVVPSHDVDGLMNYYVARTVHKGVKPPYENPETPKKCFVFNEINIDWTKPVWLVEGVFDMFKVPSSNVVPLIGKELGFDYKLFQLLVENDSTAIVALDNDANKERFKLAEMLFDSGLTNVYTASWNKRWKDPGSFLSREQFGKNVKLSRFEGIDSVVAEKIRSSLDW
jgi:hypothetical protein